MEWALIIGILTLAGGSNGFLVSRADKKRELLRAVEPVVEANISSENNHRCKLWGTIVNRGKGNAKDISIVLDGYGTFFTYPMLRPDEQWGRWEQVIENDAEIRRNQLNSPSLTITYRDQYAREFNTIYPVRQVRGGSGLLKVVIDNLKSYEYIRPQTSFLRLVRLWKKIPS